MRKKTKIIATVGPVTNSEQQIIKLYDAGINIIRFNFSHANYEEAQKTIDIINNLNKSGRTNLSLLLDTKGPEIRTGDLKEKIFYKESELFKIYIDKNKLEENSLFCDYPYIIDDLNMGDNIVIDSGLLNVRVVNKTNDYLEVMALNDALIGSRRHVNLPGIELKLPGITDKDKQDILFALKNDFAFIAASFIRKADNVAEIKNLLESKNNKTIKIISKIENKQGVENLDEIIKISDGIMVARGDLGIEVPIEKLALYQKEMINKSKIAGKFIIIATHLLETMIDNPFPTRAESSDVFNSILQKPDCLMLSGETTIGKYPIKTVEMMTRIIIEAEKSLKYEHHNFSDYGLRETDIEKKLLIRSCIHIGEDLNAKAMIVLTKTGLLAKITSAFRPGINVYAFTNSELSVKTMNCLFGIKSIFLEKWERNNFSNTLNEAIDNLKEKGIIKNGDRVVAVNDLQTNGKEIPIMEIINI